MTPQCSTPTEKDGLEAEDEGLMLLAEDADVTQELVQVKKKQVIFIESIMGENWEKNCL